MATESSPLAQLSELLESRGVDKEVLQNLLVLVNPVDLAEFIEDIDVEAQLQVLYVLDPPRAAQVLDAMGPEAKKRLVERVGDEKLSEVIHALPSHAGADLIHLLTDEKEQSVLGRLEAGKRERVERLLRYPPDTAGGRMTLNFISVPEEFTAGEALKAIQGAVRAETVAYVYAVDEAQHLKGVCSLRELLTSLPDAPIARIMRRDPIVVRPETDQEEVARRVRRYGFHAIPVTDAEGILRGVVTIGTVMDVIHAEASEDALKLAGVSGGRYQNLRTLRERVMARVPWLGVTLIGELLLAYGMRFFNATIEEFWFLALFFPVNNAIAGNHGLQSSTIITRGVATGEIKMSRFARTLWDETLIGVFVGCLSGIVTGLFACFLEWNALLGVIIAISMTLGLTVAAISGIVIPLAFHKAGKDPALAAGPFIAALNDIVCTMIYLTTATLVLR